MGFQVYNSQGQELQNLTGSAGGDLTGTYPNPTIANDAVTAAKIAAGAVGGSELASGAKNVVSTTKTTAFTSTSTTFSDVTDLSVAITPTATTSKVLVIGMIAGGGTPAQTNFFARLVRGSTAIAVGDAAGTRIQATIFSHDQEQGHTFGFVYLDSPSTTSSTTYKVQVRTQTSGQNVTVNRSTADNDGAGGARTASTITAIEVLA